MVEHFDRRHDDIALREHQFKEELRLQEIETKLTQLETKIDTLTIDVADLITTWKAASWLVSLIKVLGGIAIAITAIFSIVKGIK